MARQTGIMLFDGPMGGISFYHHKHYGWLARKSNPVSRARFKADPAFARTREVNSEMGTTSTNSALIRNGLTGFLHDVPTELFDNRLVSFMCEVRKGDTVSARGKRCVSVALELNPELLGGFEFNGHCDLSRFTGQNPVVDRAAGTISLAGFIAQNAPVAATHVQLTGFKGRLDFDANERRLAFSECMTLPLDGVERDISLDLSQVCMNEEAGNWFEIWGLKVVFMQELNGVLYALQVGAARLLKSWRVSGMSGLADEEIICDAAFGGSELSAMLPSAVNVLPSEVVSVEMAALPPSSVSLKKKMLHASNGAVKVLLHGNFQELEINLDAFVQVIDADPFVGAVDRFEQTCIQYTGNDSVNGNSEVSEKVIVSRCREKDRNGCCSGMNGFERGAHIVEKGRYGTWQRRRALAENLYLDAASYYPFHPLDEFINVCSGQQPAVENGKCAVCHLVGNGGRTFDVRNRKGILYQYIEWLSFTELFLYQGPENRPVYVLENEAAHPTFQLSQLVKHLHYQQVETNAFLLIEQPDERLDQTFVGI